MTRHWNVLEKAKPEEIQDLQHKIGVEEPIAQILWQRGIRSMEDGRSFFKSGLQDLHDPFLMKGMDKAVERLQQALEEGQKVLVYGDYDVDGTTAVSSFYHFLSSFYDEVDYYIPDRYQEGYGVSFQSIAFAAEQKVQLIISLDCGIKATEQVALAKSKGIDFIICDHHLPGKELPPAVAILDPKQNDCPYPFKELTGAGIGFKLMIAMKARMPFIETDPFDYLDLVAISTCCDIVPLIGENRILVKYGLLALNRQTRPGLAALLNRAGKKEKLFVSDLVFAIGPRINAAGRIGHASEAARLLLETDEKKLEELSLAIEEKNQERRDLDKETTEEALKILRSEKNFAENKSTLVFSENWHKGVVGIVASRLIEQVYRPTIVLTKSNGLWTGSARSVRGFDVHEAIDDCATDLEQFGGHKYAAGMSLKEEKLESFKKHFEESVSKRITEEKLTPKLNVDLELQLSDLTNELYKWLKALRPFGPSNLSPQFMTRNLVDAGGTRHVGDGTHLKLEVKSKSQDPNPITINGIAFGFGEWQEKLKSGVEFDLVYALEMNEWKGRKSLQLMVKDIKLSSAHT